MRKWTFYENNEIKPAGWLKRQLRIQADGLAGNLDKVWPDVKDSAWIGGAREGWERVPYWLDGFIPLAWLLDDEDMKSRAKKYIDAILASQQEDGWICPCAAEQRPRYDSWAVQLISKVLTVYYNYSRDERIPGVLRRVMLNYYELLRDGTIALFDWGRFRWFESFIALNFLWDRYKEPWIRELARILKEQGANYGDFTELWKERARDWTFESHIVNLCMMPKAEALSCDLLGEEYTGLAGRLLAVLDEHHSMAAGTITGDECLSGLSPSQGTETCAVVELMYSLEQLFAYTGDPRWAERLERVAFNALPASNTDDMWGHQYDQLTNQINCVTLKENVHYTTNFAESNVFGLEPNYGCCTANFGQGWPKLAASVFMHASPDDIICSMLLPSRLTSGGIRIELDTDYPFRNEAVFRIKASQPFSFTVRIPSFAENIKAFVDDSLLEKGLGNGFLFVNLFPGEHEIRLSFDVTAKLEKRPTGLCTARWGSLIFSLPVKSEMRIKEYSRDGVDRKMPYCDYEFLCAGKWNYGLASIDARPEPSAPSVCSGTPFSSYEPPLKLKAVVREVPWSAMPGVPEVCASMPDSAEPSGPAEEVYLVPYGCARLRMTEMPLVGRGNE